MDTHIKAKYKLYNEHVCVWDRPETSLTRQELWGQLHLHAALNYFIKLCFIYLIKWPSFSYFTVFFNIWWHFIRSFFSWFYPFSFPLFRSRAVWQKLLKTKKHILPSNVKYKVLFYVIQSHSTLRFAVLRLRRKCLISLILTILRGEGGRTTSSMSVWHANNNQPWIKRYSFVNFLRNGKVKDKT